MQPARPVEPDAKRRVDGSLMIAQTSGYEFYEYVEHHAQRHPAAAPTGVRTTISTAIRSPPCADQRGCAACLLVPHCHTRARSAPHFVIDNRTSRRIIRKASLIMSNLRTKRWQNVGCGYAAARTPPTGGCEPNETAFLLYKPLPSTTLGSDVAQDAASCCFQTHHTGK